MIQDHLYDHASKKLMNPCTYCSGFNGCFDAQWSQLPYVINPDLNHPKKCIRGKF